jgi:hypothetical protein
MYERIYFIYSHVDFLSDKDFTYLMNNWDSELMQYKLYWNQAAPYSKAAI